jgi:hypothetical protein
METTAAGIAEAMVMPANRPRYVLAAARMTTSTIDNKMARKVSCGAVSAATLMQISPLGVVR